MRFVATYKAAFVIACSIVLCAAVAVASFPILHGIIAHAQHAEQPLVGPVASYNMGTPPPMLDGVGSADGTCSTCPTFNAAGGPNNGPYYEFTAANGEQVVIPGTTIDLDTNDALTIMYDFRGEVGIIERLMTRAFQFIVGGNFSANTLLTIAGETVFTNGEEKGGAWHNVAFTYDGSTDIVVVYVDGVFSRTELSATVALTPNTNDITLSDLSVFFALGADLTNLQFFDVALTAAEVAAIAGVDL